jgi:DNA recombination protein RmuC
MDWLFVALALVVLVQLVLLVLLWSRTGNAHLEGIFGASAARQAAENQQQTAALLRTEVTATSERLERELRDEVRGSSNTQRTEFTANIAQLQQAVNERLAQSAALQNEQTGQQLRSFAQTLHALTESNERRLVDIRTTLEGKLKELQTDNAAKLDEMRKTVDERLHATLEQRLGESFKLVSDRLEQVHRGLGEMQNLASGVGDLKRVLTNVKTRGTWGEIQLGALLEQVLAPDQYGRNVATRPGSRERVEFAVKLPGRDAGLSANASQPVWLENRIRSEAKQLSEKYVEPPHTTDFAILFVPTEGLYAELLRRPGLADALQREYKVSIAGPTTLHALLNSLQMGFRTLAIEKRSAEVWAVLGAVKTEFAKFGEVLAKTKQQLQTVANSIDQAETRTRSMERKLRQVEQLPDESAQELLGEGGAAK